jgi:hypothetical protein
VTGHSLATPRCTGDDACPVHTTRQWPGFCEDRHGVGDGVTVICDRNFGHQGDHAGWDLRRVIQERIFWAGRPPTEEHHDRS